MNEANEIVFTSAALLDLLLQIDELEGYTIGVTETLDGNLQIQIGDSVYLVDSSNSTTIEVEDNIVNEIETTTDDAYLDIIEDTADVSDIPQYEEDIDFVEGSIIKEIAKSLTLGGMIRFATKHLLK